MDDNYISELLENRNVENYNFTVNGLYINASGIEQLIQFDGEKYILLRKNRINNSRRKHFYHVVDKFDEIEECINRL